MQARHKIGILTHAGDDLRSSSSLVNLLVDVWSRAGIEIVVFRGTEHFEPADALILHVDLTVIPQKYLQFSRRFPVVINGRVHDISKRGVSSQLLSAGDCYEGEVIVKTDLNAGGSRERRREKTNPLRRVLRKYLPWTWTGVLSARSYPIFPSPSSVPSRVWKNRRLVVEKYTPERDGEFYCLRQWVFFGDREINQRVFSRSPIVKAHNVVHREHDLPVPESLRNRRRDLGFDFGKFDYVLFNGEAALLDANRTPTAERSNPSPRLSAIVTELAQGLDGYLSGSSAPES